MPFAARYRSLRGKRHRHDASCEVFKLVVVGDYRTAASTVRSRRSVDAALIALVSAVNDSNPAAIERVWQLHEDRPHDGMAASCLLLWRVQMGDWPGVVTMLSTPLRSGACLAAFFGAYQAGAFSEAASVGEALLRILPKPELAYSTACCWALSGDSEKALSRLQLSIDRGWTDWGHLDADPDLASLRALPSFDAWRQAARAVPAV